MPPRMLLPTVHSASLRPALSLVHPVRGLLLSHIYLGIAQAPTASLGLHSRVDTLQPGVFAVAPYTLHTSCQRKRIRMTALTCPVNTLRHEEGALLTKLVTLGASWPTHSTRTLAALHGQSVADSQAQLQRQVIRALGVACMSSAEGSCCRLQALDGWSCKMSGRLSSKMHRHALFPCYANKKRSIVSDYV